MNHYYIDFVSSFSIMANSREEAIEEFWGWVHDNRDYIECTQFDNIEENEVII